MWRYCGGLYLVLFLASMLVLSRLSAGQTLEPRAAPDIQAEMWLNSPPLQLLPLRGRVVLVEFWTYGCYNCVNVQPYIKQWHADYAQQGLTVVAVHTPEFEREKKLANVQAYVRENKIVYPVVLDNDYAIWNRYDNRYWPALYLIDKQGRLRYYHFGEGQYRQTEQMIQTLLAEP